MKELLNNNNNTQYHRCESLETNSVPASIDDVLESSICKALLLTSHEVKSDDLHACHCLKKKDTVIVIKFKCRKQKCSILINRNNLHNKSDVLTQLHFSGRLFISESICHDNHQSSYKCRQLKNAGKIHSTWFRNNFINVKLNERSQPTNIHHVIDIQKLLRVDNLDKSINNTSF